MPELVMFTLFVLVVSLLRRHRTRYVVVVLERDEARECVAGLQRRPGIAALMASGKLQEGLRRS